MKNVYHVNKIFPNGFSLEKFEKTFEAEQNIINQDRNVVKKIDLSNEETVIKSFKIPNSLQGFIYKFFRKSKARRSYEYSKMLNQNGIKTPEPLGFIEVYDRFRLRQSYFISRKLDFDFSLDFATEKKTKEYKTILNSFIDFTYKMHKKNFMHLDYVIWNICIKKIDAGYDFYLVDLNRLYMGPVNAKAGIENLSRISKDPEIIKILANEYAKKTYISKLNSQKYLIKSIKRDLRKLKLKSFIKKYSKSFTKIPSTAFVWDHHNNQPYSLNDKKLKNKIFLLSWYSNIKIIISTLFALLIIPIFYFKKSESFEKEIDSFGLCVNLDKPIDSQKLVDNDDLIKMISDLSIQNILVRIPLADFENIEKYLSFISELKDKNVLVCVLQDRSHINDEKLLKERLDFIFSQLYEFVSEFQIGNSINRKKWAFLTVDEYLSFFKIAYDLKIKKFPKIKLLGGNIIDFDIPFFARSIFHFRALFYDGIATQLYVDRRGSPENKQLGFNTLSKIKIYSALAQASLKTSNELYITEVNWPLEDMEPWAPAKNHLIKESLQSRYLVRYYLLMLASGKVKRCYWHQLIAPGYGLVNNLEGQIIKRDAYYCFKYLVEMLNGGVTKKLITENNLYCLVVEKNKKVIEAVWSNDKNISFKSNPSQKIFDMRGKKIDTETSPEVSINGEVIYIENFIENYKEFNLQGLSEKLV